MRLRFNLVRVQRGLAIALLLSACGGRTSLDDGAAPTLDSSPSNDCGSSLGSGSQWMVYASETGSNAIGPAQPVCVNATTPTPCPKDAVIYGGLGGGWTVDISQLDAVWIWAPVYPSDQADFAKYVFKRTLVLSGVATANIQMAADDFASVEVNGTLVGSVGSITDYAAASLAESTLTTFDLTPYLVSGENTIVVVAQNGGPQFTSDCTHACDYAHNPAGVVFGGKVECQ